MRCFALYCRAMLYQQQLTGIGFEAAGFKTCCL